MSAPINSLKNFFEGGQNSDDAPERISNNDYLEAYNCRNAGTSAGEDGYTTNIESTLQLADSPPVGLNKVIGLQGFSEPRIAIGFRYNSGGLNQIVKIDYDTNILTVLYTDQTDSAGGLAILPLNPQNYVQIKLVDDKYLVWTDGLNEVGYINLETLEAGGYGQLLLEDLTLIKPQNLIPASGVYISDIGRASNFLKGKLFQFISQYENDDFNLSTWSTISKRIIPQEENTPTIGSDVTQNNGIIVGVSAGSIRATTLNIACRYGDNIFNTVKSVTRAYITALPDTYPDPSSQIYEAYDPSTNTYYFVYYNTSLLIPIPATTTDQLYDYIWIANAVEILNGNIIAQGNLAVGYQRPIVDISVQAAGYDPNISVPATGNTDRMRISYNNTFGNNGATHTWHVQLNFLGLPATGDVITITLVDSRDARNIYTYPPYTVTSADAGDLLSTIGHLSATISGSSFRQDTASPQVILTIITPPYYVFQRASITLFNSGATVAKSIHGILDNSSYQFSLFHYDQFGRPFPIDTDNTFIVPTPSFAQLLGNAVQVAWAINSLPPPKAVSAQWGITKNNTVIQGALLDVFGNLLNFIGSFDAAGAGSPTLAAGTGTTGDTYQITVPNASPSYDLGNGIVQYNTGDYVVYNGSSWDVISKEIGDLTNAGSIIAIKINPLNLFNQLYTNQGVNTVLSYDFSPGDRCTIHAYCAPSGTPTFTYLNSPCVDVDVYGYDTGTYIVKIEKSAGIDTMALAGQNVYLRLYSPLTSQSGGTVTTDNTTIFYEIGEQIPIVNGAYTTTQGIITDGDVYFKSRQYQGGIDPGVAYSLLATDFNFSDFYASEFTSYGRPRSFYDVLEATQQKASVAPGKTYILGSRLNGLNRFYEEDVYGDGNGQTSSSQGGIQVMWQRGDVLCVGQEGNWAYIPVNYAWQILNDELTGLAISEKLLNNCRYESRSIGIGTARESFVSYQDLGYFVSPGLSEPCQLRPNGVVPISMKMSKFFKSTLQTAIGVGLKITGYYDPFNNEYVLTIQLSGGNVFSRGFNATNWNLFDSYTPTPLEITPANGAHCTVSYDNTTGIATYTPATNYVGNDVATFTFNDGSGSVTKNVCLNWTAGSDAVNPFSFTPLVGQALSTVVYSNIILIMGNTIPAAITITGGQYNINGASWVSAAGTVNSGDMVQVRQTTSASTSTLTTAALTIDGQSANFNATTVSGGGGSSININNITTSFEIAFVDLSGAATYSLGPVLAGSNYSQGITAGTYTVHVKVLGSSGSSTLNINGTTYSVPSSGSDVTQVSVVAPIIVTLS